MRNINFISISLFMILLAGCVGSTTLYTYDGQKSLGNEHVSFVPSQSWYTYEEQPWRKDQSNDKAQWVYLHNKSTKGARYDIDVNTWPFKWWQRDYLFDKDAKYYLTLKDEEMSINENDKEQGIGYKRQWVVYVQGMKCTNTIFSRSQGRLMKDITSKNYGIACGYYAKVEGKRILMIDYRYNYTGNSLRHQKDADTPQSELISLERAELDLKQAV